MLSAVLCSCCILPLRSVCRKVDFSSSLASNSFLFSFYFYFDANKGGDELQFVLEEVTAVYASLTTATRDASRHEMPRALQQVLLNLRHEEPSVVLNGLKLLSQVSELCVVRESNRA